MDDPVIPSVLAMIATNQREQHASNTKILERISEDVSEMRTEIAVQTRDMMDIKAWRRETVDPFIASARDISSQAKGAGKMAKFLYAAGGVIGVSALYKFGAAIIAAVAK